MYPKITDEQITILDNTYFSEQVKAVSMGEIETTTDTKKVLFTFGLSTCIGLYVYCEKFGILCHIDSGDVMGKHFIHEFKQTEGKWKMITIKFKETDKIMYRLRQNINQISTPIKIGMVKSIDSEVECEDEIKKIDFAIDSMIFTIEDMGLSVEKQKPITSSCIIIDTNKQLIKTDNDMLDNQIILK